MKNEPEKEWSLKRIAGDVTASNALLRDRRLTAILRQP